MTEALAKEEQWLQTDKTSTSEEWVVTAVRCNCCFNRDW